MVSEIRGRPRYETEQDLERETACVSRFLNASKNNRTVVKLYDTNNVHYSNLDRFAYDTDSKVAVALIEVKCRSHAFTKYPTLLISAGKWRDGVAFSQACGVPFVILIAFADGDYYYVYRPADVAHGIVSQREAKLNNDKIWCEWGGRTVNTRDSGDIEPVMHIPMKLFRKVA